MPICPCPHPPQPPERTSYMSADLQAAKRCGSSRATPLVDHAAANRLRSTALIAQTTGGQAAITDNVSNAAALIGLGFFVERDVADMARRPKACLRRSV